MLGATPPVYTCHYIHLRQSGIQVIDVRSSAYEHEYYDLLVFFFLQTPENLDGTKH